MRAIFVCEITKPLSFVGTMGVALRATFSVADWKSALPATALPFAQAPGKPALIHKRKLVRLQQHLREFLPRREGAGFG